MMPTVTTRRWKAGLPEYQLMKRSSTSLGTKTKSSPSVMPSRKQQSSSEPRFKDRALETGRGTTTRKKEGQTGKQAERQTDRQKD
jgi:hypothetical protein